MMLRRIRLLGLLGLVMVGGSFCVCVPVARAAGEGGDRDRSDIATVAEIRAAARPLERELGAASRTEPDLCAGIDKPTTTPNNGTRAEGGISVSPASLELVNVVPGRTYRGCINITNYDDVELRGYITDLDIVAGDELDASVKVEVNASGVGSWIVPGERAFRLGPMQNRSIPYIIEVPNPVPAGTVVGGIAAEIEPTGGIRSFLTQRVYSSSPGGTRGKLEVSDIDSDRVVMSDEAGTFRARLTVRNQSDYLESFDARLRLSVFGHTVLETAMPGAALLPTAGTRLVIREKDVPWIGVFRPEVQLNTRAGTITQKLPWVVVVPPTPYFVALLAAILLPLTYLIWRWHRRRKEWMAFLIDEMEREERGDSGDGHDPDEYWDPMRQ